MSIRAGLVVLALVLGIVDTAAGQGPQRANGPQQAGAGAAAGFLVCAVAVGCLIGIGIKIWIILFMVSDAFIGESRFVQSRSWQPLTIIVTYHVAQALLVVSLTT